MSASGHPSADHRAIEARAAAWIAERDRLHDHGGWTAEREAALQAWLAASTAHRVAYLRLQQAWQRADRLGACRPLPEAAARAAAAASTRCGRGTRRRLSHSMQRDPIATLGRRRRTGCS